MWVKFTQTKQRLTGIMLPLDKVHGPARDIVVDRSHPLFGQRTGVLYHLLAHLAEAWIDRRVISVRGLAVQHSARAILRAERGFFG
jgi:hypothetical protein